jgi:hypothetical protein
MSFKIFYNFSAIIFLLILSACSDKENETPLVDLFTAASFDIIDINFPTDTTEDIVSVDSFFDYTIEGLKSNGVDIIPINSDVVWSLSDGAVSSINQSGRLTSGSVAEVITITAKVGHLSATQIITISAAKFDQVVQLNSTPVLVNVCQIQKIIPIGSYLNDDGSEEIRAVDSSVIQTIEWLIRNQEDNASSQRALIKTANNQTDIQGLETGNIIIQAKAPSISQGNVIVTSADFPQTIDNNMNSLKLCLNSETDLAACSLVSVDVVKNNTVSVMAVANYQATDGSNFNQNITSYSKWGVDNTNSSIALSADRQQLDITGTNINTSSTVSVACGKIEQTVTDTDINNGVVLNVPVSCATGDLNCKPASTVINVKDLIVDSLSVTANGTDLVNNTALVLTAQPFKITFKVVANFVNGTSLDVSTDLAVNYNNLSTNVITVVSGAPNEFTVDSDGDAEIQIIYSNQIFVAKITIPQ